MDLEQRKYFRSMISQRAVKQTFFVGDKRYNASWDYAISPDRHHYLSICAEGPKIDSMVYEYIPETCELKKCVDTKTDIITYPRTVRPSKVHTCMSFMEDGRIIMNNHTTAGAPSHPDWMTEAYFSHPYEGFPGSNVFIYDPKTGKTEDLGIPVPRESIYGGKYDPIHRAYYFTGYFRGHGYRLDLDDRKVTDYGQVTEYSTYFHIKGPDGNVYCSTDKGVMYRYNVHTMNVETLKAEIPLDRDDPESKAGNVMAFATFDKDNMMYLAAHKNEYIYKYDIYNDLIEKVGSPVPSWYRDEYKGLYMIFGMDFDSDGVLWYGLKILRNCFRLVSWDIKNGGEPVDHGIIGTVDHASWNFSLAYILDDKLFSSTTNHATDGPAVIEIDLKMMKEDVEKPRELGHDPIIFRGTKDVDLYPGEEKLTGGPALDATEGVAVREIIGGHPFSDGILRTKPRNNQWSFRTRKRYVTKIWKKLGPGDISKVVDLDYRADGTVCAITGSEETGYYKSIVKDSVILSTEKTEFTPKDPKIIEDKYKDYILPCPAGRSWIAVATCEAELADGSFLVGTKSGGLAIIKDGKCFSLGFVSTTGPVRDLSASPDKRTVYGVCGDPDEMGFIFSYNMDFGVVCHGSIHIQDDGADVDDSHGVSYEPVLIRYSPDGESLAVGVRDRLGCVYQYYFEDKEPGFEEALIKG